MNDLVDTTEMYLRTVLELEEEGVVPRRARIAERLHQSGPTVSQTVARMERDGLLAVEGDRRLVLSPVGRAHAVAVMRRHRLAEVLLVKVIGMPYETAHDEACRWEHVMSATVEKRVRELLGNPRYSPYGNPIPGPEDGPETLPIIPAPGERHLAALGGSGKVTISRICEIVQTNSDMLRALHNAGVDVGATVTVSFEHTLIMVDSGETRLRLPRDVASQIFAIPPSDQ